MTPPEQVFPLTTVSLRAWPIDSRSVPADPRHALQNPRRDRNAVQGTRASVFLQGTRGRTPRRDTLPLGSQSGPHTFQRNNGEMEPVVGRLRTALLPIAPTRWRIHGWDLMPLRY